MTNEKPNRTDENELTDILRVEGINSKGYGIIPKLVMQDNRLTAEAKCIYAYFCSYAGAGSQAFPSVSLILKHLGISKTRYYAHLSLLKNFGYIKTQQMKQNGKFNKTIYTLCTNPTPIENTEVSPCPNFEDTEETPCPSFVDTQIVYTENRDTNINSIIKLTNNKNNNQSINQSLQKLTPKKDGLIENSLNDHIDSRGSETNKNYDNDQQYSLEDIREQLEVEILEQEDKIYTELAELVYDVVNDKAKTIRINKADVPTEVVRSRILKLRSPHIQYVVNNFQQQTTKIKNIRAYLITSLYNSYTSISGHYTSQVNEDAG